MKVFFDVQNVSGERTTFAFVVIKRQGMQIVMRKETEAYDPGERVKLTIDWPTEDFTPFQCIWKPWAGRSMRWLIHSATVGDGLAEGRPLVASVPAHF